MSTSLKAFRERLGVSQELVADELTALLDEPGYGVSNATISRLESRKRGAGLQTFYLLQVWVRAHCKRRGWAPVQLDLADPRGLKPESELNLKAMFEVRIEHEKSLAEERELQNA